MFKNTLLTIAFTFCFIIFSVGNSFAQKTIQTQRISKQLIPNLGHALNDYQVFSYDIAIKNLSLKTNDEITLDIAGQKFDFRIFTDNLQIIGLESDERIFLGGQSSNGGQVSLTLADDFIYGYIERGGTKYYIQPLSYFTSEATTGQYVLFDAKDIVEDHKEHVCGDHTKTRVKSHALNKSQTSGCKVINMAIANTNDMLVKYGSTAAVQNHNLAVLNNVQSDFRSEFNFNLEFNVTAIYIAPDTNSEPFETDPNNGNADEMLTQFIFWASDGSGSVPGGTMGGFQTALDMGVLWSARDMVLNGEPVVGLANTPGWFHLLKDFSAIPSRLQALMSHEIGHNLGAIHDPAGSNTIMAPSTHTTINWSAASVADVDSYVAALTSLSNCSTLGTPVAAIGQTTTVVCQGSMLTLEDQSAYGETRTWSAANQTFSDPTCAKQTITFNDLGYNIIDLTSINGAGQDETATYVKVEAEPFSTCDPSSTTGTGGINKITFENINHESALANVSGSYENNICAGIANVEANTSYDVFIDVTAVNYMNFYFDFNGDGDFDDLNESGSNFQTTNDGNYLVNLSMPADPNLNEILRMRVIVSNTTIPNACYTPSIGQVEDYGLFFATPQVLGCTNPASSNYNSFATVDDGSCATVNTLTFYQDSDSDGYGNPLVTIEATTAPSGYVADNTDCNDSDDTVNPGVPEICDGSDNNCNNTIDEGLATTIYYLDSDSDGYGDAAVSITDCTQPTGYVLDATDCDDSDATIYPNATELCDGIDNDCNGTIDDNTNSTVFYLDSDSDGYGDANVSITDCTQPTGYVLDATDCDDSDANIYPNATEICDGIDNDCNGTIDDNTSATTFYLDSDSDGYGDAAVSITDCTQPSGYVLDATDCDDSDATIYPNATEICDGIDNDCNGTIDDNTSATTFYLDSDSDGYGDAAVSITDCIQPTGYVLDATDCDDSDATIYPNAAEICDGIDNDCNGTIDDNTNSTVFYLDSDSDGYGDAAVSITDCTQPTGYVLDATDCDDSDATIYPNATELCDGIDNDCNGTIDDNTSATTFYLDSDSDGYGDATVSITDCTQPTGYVLDATDCDDSDANIYPNATELCDGLDNDCNGTIDDNTSATTFYLDSDSDGYGDAAVSITDCTQPTGYVLDATDCDDSDATIYPNAAELCDGIDNDCNGTIDDNTNSTVFYLDSDSDGYGDATVSITDCTQPTGYVLDATDCDDSDATIYPNAAELCDGIDNDCNGTIDDNTSATTFYLDSDSDGYGDAAVSITDCTQPSGYVLDATDCDDSDATIYPNATEICDGIDNDCNGTIDDNTSATTFYLDSDSDGYGDAAVSITDCIQPTGYVLDATDCDDSDATIYPNATELCDGLDNDCNGTIDDNINSITFYLDSDNDGYGDFNNSISDCAQPTGYVLDGTDCDDSDATIYPNATELCDGIDNDCNGSIDESTAIYYLDNDGDGFGNAEIFIQACEQPDGYVPDADDCDDNNNTIYPSAPELCDDIDNNCNGIIDDEATAVIFYYDADNDGYGDTQYRISSCEQPSGYVLNDNDCNDNDASIFPNAEEICDGVDNNCDGIIDENYITYFLDNDGDGFGDAENSIEECDQPIGYVLNGDDCDDNNATTNPMAEELCDGIDNNCDGVIEANINCNSIEGYIFNDRNLNGIKDFNEIGIQGIRVNLIQVLRSSSNESSVTDQDGYYLFSDLEPGEYLVEIDLSGLDDQYVVVFNNDELSMGENNRIISYPISVDGDTHLVAPISYYQGGTVTGRIYFDSLSLPVQTWVFIYDITDPFTKIDSIQTLENGSYGFEGIAEGEYFLSFMAPLETTFILNGDDDDPNVISTTYVAPDDVTTIGLSEPFTVVASGVYNNMNAILSNANSEVLGLKDLTKLSAVWDQESNGVELTWSYDQVLQVREILIERKHESETVFSQIKSLDEITNIYLDQSALSGINYYKVTLILEHNEVRYSQIAAVRIAAENEIMSIYPNPSDDYTYIKSRNMASKVKSLTMYDRSGALLQIPNLEVLTEDLIRLDLTGMPSGVYYLRIRDQSTSKTQKLVILD